MRPTGQVPAEVRARHVHHLVGVLNRSRYPDRSGPIEVHVREVVAQFLDEVCAQSLWWLSFGAEIHEVRGGDRTLIDILRHQEEVLEVPSSDRVVQDYAGLWVVHLHVSGRFRVALEREDPGVDPLLNDDEVECWAVARGRGRI